MDTSLIRVMRGWSCPKGKGIMSKQPGSRSTTSASFSADHSQCFLSPGRSGYGPNRGDDLAFASLTFLGLGPPPPLQYGVDVARPDLLKRPLVAVWPGLISLTVLAVNLLGDGLRDVLDPRLTEK
jgi:hypothetical protein